MLLGPGGHGISFSYGDLDEDAAAALGEAGGGAGLRVLLRTGSSFLRRESLLVHGELLRTPTPTPPPTPTLILTLFPSPNPHP